MLMMFYVIRSFIFVVFLNFQGLFIENLWHVFCFMQHYATCSVECDMLRWKMVSCTVAGQIVSVETLTVPIQDGVVDCHVTRWTECANTDIPCAFVLRVFYNREVNGRIYGSEKVHVGRLASYYEYCLQLTVFIYSFTVCRNSMKFATKSLNLFYQTSSMFLHWLGNSVVQICCNSRKMPKMDWFLHAQILLHFAYYYLLLTYSYSI